MNAATPVLEIIIGITCLAILIGSVITLPLIAAVFTEIKEEKEMGKPSSYPSPGNH